MLPGVPNQPETDSFSPTGYGRRGRPMLFQVTDPVNRPLWEYLLALHTNPTSLTERFAKSKNVVMTYGGFIEFVWPDELDSLSANHSAGAFLGPFQGLMSASEGRPIRRDSSGLALKAAEHGRHGTLAWERQEDLLEVFRHNGNIFNGRGLPAIRGRIMCIYDRGVYIGHFTTFTVKETDEKPYTFELDWEFKIEETLYNFPIVSAGEFVPGGGVFMSEIDRVRRNVGDTAFEALRNKLNIPPITEPTPQQQKQSNTSGNGPPVPAPQVRPESLPPSGLNQQEREDFITPPSSPRR